MISPTVGRVILFFPPSTFTGAKPSKGEPLPALISRVWSDRLINVGGFDADGKPFNATSVLLIQGDEPEDQPLPFMRAEWMPYQKGQAAKTEALDAKVAAPVSDQSIEQEIQAKGLTAPRVKPEWIDELMSRIVYTSDVRPNGSTTTLVHAFLDGNFYLATGVSACVSAANFDAELGIRIATENVQAAARDKLWELEGYALKQRQYEAE